MLDMFGTIIEVDDFVLYADHGDNDEPVMALYKVTEVTEPNVITAELLNGGTGNWFYLSDPIKRAVVVGNHDNVYGVARYTANSVIN